MTLPTRRLRPCVEVWPEAETGAYDPHCCRFPKSCSATIYDEGRVSEEDLEPAPDVARQSAIEAGDESVCHRCHGPNTPWSAPSPLWNEVMRGGSINGNEIFDGIVCPTCFAVMAEQRGIGQFWRLTAQRVHVELETVTPSGRTWDAAAFRWQDPTEQCEWWPEKAGPALAGEGGCSNSATLTVGSAGTWHLCTSCADLPRFKRMKRRIRATGGA